MNNSENIRLSGSVSITIVDSNGNIKDKRIINNLIVNSGLGFITGRMLEGILNPMSHIALGTDQTAVVAQQTQLLSQAGDRRSVTASNPTNSTVQYSAVFPAGFSTGALTEAGVFNAAVAGTMLCRTVFPAITKTEFDIAIVNWTISLVAA